MKNRPLAFLLFIATGIGFAMSGCSLFRRHHEQKPAGFPRKTEGQISGPMEEQPIPMEAHPREPQPQPMAPLFSNPQ